MLPTPEARGPARLTLHIDSDKHAAEMFAMVFGFCLSVMVVMGFCLRQLCKQVRRSGAPKTTHLQESPRRDAQSLLPHAVNRLLCFVHVSYSFLDGQLHQVFDRIDTHQPNSILRSVSTRSIGPLEHVKWVRKGYLLGS